MDDMENSSLFPELAQNVVRFPIESEEEQPQQRHRERDGLGKGRNSHRKHASMLELVEAQVAILSMKSRRGAIIDMHAGDGSGVETPQLGLLDDELSAPTPVIARRMMRRHDCAVVLCESKKKRRDALSLSFPEAKILHTNKYAPDYVRGAQLDWVVVLNDPCGPSEHAVDVMQEIGALVRKSDFLVVVNVGAIGRMAGLRENGDDHGINADQIRAARKAREKYTWMLDPSNWMRSLKKSTAVTAKRISANRAFHGQTILLTNWAANFSPKRYTIIRSS